MQARLLSRLLIIVLHRCGRADLVPLSCHAHAGVPHTCLTHACPRDYKRQLIVSRPYATKCRVGKEAMAWQPRLTSKLPLKGRHSKALNGNGNGNGHTG